jgi:hypothetical protein
MKPSISIELIAAKIYLVGGLKVMIDRDLAQLYEVETKYLTRQVRRNIGRFPDDFMFRLTRNEFQRCQIGTFGTSQKGSRKYLPYAFTEQGVAMLSGILNSNRAVRVNIQIMRTFTKIREMVQMNKELWRKVEIMERKYDGQFKVVFDALRKLFTPLTTRRKIGFHP